MERHVALEIKIKKRLCIRYITMIVDGGIGYIWDKNTKDEILELAENNFEPPTKMDRLYRYLTKKGRADD